MKKSLYTLIIAFTFITGTTLLTSCGSGTTNESDSAEHHNMEGHNHDEMASADYACPMHPDEIGKESDKCSKCGMFLTQKVEADTAVYSCPMHPEEKGVKGDTCSKCKMDLVASSGKMSKMNCKHKDGKTCGMCKGKMASKSTCNHKDGEKCTCDTDKVKANCSCPAGACVCGKDKKTACNHKDGEKCTCNKVAMKCDHKKGGICAKCKKA